MIQKPLPPGLSVVSISHDLDCFVNSLTHPTTIYVDSSRSSNPSKDEDNVIKRVNLPSAKDLLSAYSRSPSLLFPIFSASTSPVSTSTFTFKPKNLKLKPEPVPLKLTLLKPLLFMNVTGKSVLKASQELEFSHSNIIIIHDDMQRELGKISIKNGGSANGHNGIKSVIDHLKTDEFRRLRIGIGRPPSEIDDRSHDIVSNFVLSRIPPNEMEIYNNDVFPRCKDELFKTSINI